MRSVREAALLVVVAVPEQRKSFAELCFMFSGIGAWGGLGDICVAIEICGSVGFGGLVTESARGRGIHIKISISKTEY